ncbi:MAG: M28 family peptidase, partial [Actinobacteria bacterium]
LGGDFGSMFKSTSYELDITAAVWAIDLVLPPGAAPNTSTSGCEAADYAGVPDGAIIIVQRGTCTFAQKFTLADASPAGAMVFINEGQPGRTEPLWFNFDGLDIPTFAATVETATALANGVLSGDTGLTARFKVDWRPGTYRTHNVVAETTTGDPNNVIVVGAHLDSVGVGAGINDNGSGSSTILEIAEQMTKVKPRNKVRFIWFSAEESGLLGSEAYVASLSEAERSQIAAMLNFDMVGSPNFVRFVYDGDLSDSPPPPSGAPEGSAAIEELFLQYFARQGLATEPTAFDGRSDYGPFIEVGIPAGGLFTGAEGIKTPDQVAIYGGVAGEQYDQCYHLSCDDIDNLSLVALDQMSDAAAHATISLAQSTQAVNGQRGKGNFNVEGGGQPAPIGSITAF